MHAIGNYFQQYKSKKQTKIYPNFFTGIHHQEEEGNIENSGYRLNKK